jgi:hypothetical protein
MRLLALFEQLNTARALDTGMTCEALAAHMVRVSRTFTLQGGPCMLCAAYSGRPQRDGGPQF